MTAPATSPGAAASGQAATFRRTSFVDRGSPVFWAMVAMDIVGLVLVVRLNLAWLLRDMVLGVTSAGAWVIYGAVLVWVVLRLQRYRRRESSSVAGAFLWGGLAATGFAFAGNTALNTLITNLAGAGAADAWRAPVLTPLVEESLKAIGIIGMALIPGVRLRGPLDGAFYGVLVGLGYQVVEDFFYTLFTGSTPFVGVASMVLIRGIAVGLFSHAIYGGILGAAIGYAAMDRRRPFARRWAPFLGATLAVMALHGLWDAQGGFTWITPVVAVATLALFIWLLRWAHDVEVRRLVSYAPVAVERGVMTPAEESALQTGAAGPKDKAAGRRRHAQLRYLAAVEDRGADSSRAVGLASLVPHVGGGRPA